MYQRDPIIHVKPTDNDGFTVITITGPGAEEYAERFRKMLADDGKRNRPDDCDDDNYFYCA